jgi:hypothetical protein
MAAFYSLSYSQTVQSFHSSQITNVVGREILINYELPGSHEYVERTSGILSFPIYFPGGVAFDSLSRRDFDCVKH